MPRITWGAIEKRFYESGVDRGVLYLKGAAGVPWDGITAVSENTSGGETKSYYQGGIKSFEITTPEEFEATLSALTYPDEFSGCDGVLQARPGLFITQQARKPFGLSYRTGIGSTDPNNFHYKIHIVYNALATPTNREYSTVSDSANPITLQWKLTTTPAFSSYAPTAHLVIDTRTADPQVVSSIEDILYGTDSDPARLPDIGEVLDIFDVPTLVVTEYPDGTFTLLAPDYAWGTLNDEEFDITWPTAVMLDEDSYTISS